MTIFFTLCSNNYLANAISLHQSFKQHHFDTKFVIGIVDNIDHATSIYLNDYETLYVDELKEIEIDDMKTRYNIIEINTAVKPYYIDYFFKQKNANKVVYLDPDMLLFNPMQEILDKLDTYSYLLTPHSFTPIYDCHLLTEQITLCTGTFNLGFFAIKNDETGNQLIDWWKRKLYKECLLDMRNGYFVDQKWMNLSICYFRNYHILKQPGINMAHWNLHERTLSKSDNGGYLVNNEYQLILYHFSAFSPDNITQIARWQNRFSFESRPDIKDIFNNYICLLKKNGYDVVKLIQPAYGVPLQKKISVKDKIKRKIINYLS